MIDLASRKVVGWALADHMRTELISDALLMAFGGSRRPAGVVFHSDRGCQYTSRDFRQLATDRGVVLSFGREEGRAAAGTTRWPRASSPPSNESSSTAALGQQLPASAEPSSTGSKAGTRPADYTRHSVTSARPNTKPASTQASSSQAA